MTVGSSVGRCLVGSVALLCGVIGAVLRNLVDIAQLACKHARFDDWPHDLMTGKKKSEEVLPSRICRVTVVRPAGQYLLISKARAVLDSLSAVLVTV